MILFNNVLERAQLLHMHSTCMGRVFLCSEETKTRVRKSDVQLLALMSPMIYILFHFTKLENQFITISNENKFLRSICSLNRYIKRTFTYVEGLEADESDKTFLLTNLCRLQLNDV